MRTYKLKLVYTPEPKTQTLKESVTYCASIDLFLRGIESFQTSASILEFESERDRLLAVLILSESSSFTCAFVD